MISTTDLYKLSVAIHGKCILGPWRNDPTNTNAYRRFSPFGQSVASVYGQWKDDVQVGWYGDGSGLRYVATKDPSFNGLDEIKSKIDEQLTANGYLLADS